MKICCENALSPKCDFCATTIYNVLDESIKCFIQNPCCYPKTAIMWETEEANELYLCIRHDFQIGTKIVLSKIHPMVMKKYLPPGGQIGLLKCSSNLITAQLGSPPWLPTACLMKSQGPGQPSQCGISHICPGLSLLACEMDHFPFSGNTPTLSHLRLCVAPSQCSPHGLNGVPPTISILNP